MRSARPRPGPGLRRRAPGRAARRLLALPVLLALGVGLTPGVAAATDPAPTATNTTSETTSTTPGEEAAVSAVVALAHTRQASLDLGVLGGGVQVHTERMQQIADALSPVAGYLDGAVGDPPPTRDLDLAETEAELQRAINALVSPPTVDVSGVQDSLGAVLATLLDIVSEQVAPAVGDTFPTPEELQALAGGIEQAIGDAAAEGGAVARTTAETLHAQLAAWTAYLTDERHQRTVTEAVTTLLLALGHAVDPLPSALAPTAAAVSDAAGAFVAWADDLAYQGASADSPFYDTADTDSDEAAPDDGAPLVDEGLAVGEEPVVVATPLRVLRPEGLPAPATPLSGTTTELTVDCGMYAGESCAPPMKYAGGPVVRNPVVRVVLAGSWWRSAEGQSLSGAFDQLFAGMSGSAYQSVLQQYHDRIGYVSGTVAYQGKHIVDGTPATIVREPAAYAVKADEQRSDWRTSANVVWVVALPKGSVADYDDPELGPYGKCGYQGAAASGGRTYILAVVDYPREGCRYDGGVRGGATTIAAHEYVGAVTNPEGTGWHDGLGQHLPDLCRARLFDNGPGGERVSMLWSNGARSCTTGEAPRWSYRVVDVHRPTGDAGSYAYTKGHAYDGGIVRVKNTGNMAWTNTGAKKTYLATADNACSPFADSAAASGWASCRRIEMVQQSVAPGETAEFMFTLRPDGSFLDGEPDLAAHFRLVAGTTWMANTGSTMARLSGMAVRTFGAELVTGTLNTGYYAVGQPGTDAKVSVTLRNTGTATWFPREVVTIGTPQGTESAYAAPSWPTGPGGCRRCRAHRVSQLVAPGATYTFDVTLRIPDSKVIGDASFVVFSDVRQVGDKRIVSREAPTARIDIKVIPLPRPLGAHEVEGAGFADHGVHADDLAEGTSVRASTSGFSCAGVASLDAVSTQIRACTAQVTSSSGAVWSGSAPNVRAHGPAAVTTGFVEYDSNAGDTIVVCWTVESAFLDGTRGTASGCA